MSEFKVKTELLAERCEICHQSDLFSPETGICSRCQNLTTKIEKPTTKQIAKNPIDQKIERYTAIFTAIIGTSLIAISTLNYLFILFLAFILSWTLANLFVYLTTSLKEVYPDSLLSNIKFSPATIGDFPNLDDSKLQQHTFELKALGFTRVGDYKLDKENQSYFVRIFIHPKNHALAEIHLLPRSSQNGQTTFLIITSFFEKEWLFYSINSPFLINYFFQLPKNLFLRDSSSSLKEMLETHLSHRESLMTSAKLELILNPSINYCFDIFYKMHEQQKELYANKKLFTLFFSQLMFRISASENNIDNLIAKVKNNTK